MEILRTPRLSHLSRYTCTMHSRYYSWFLSCLTGLGPRQTDMCVSEAEASLYTVIGADSKCQYCSLHATSSHIAIYTLLSVYARLLSSESLTHVRCFRHDLFMRLLLRLEQSPWPATISRASHSRAYKSPLNRFDFMPGFSLDGRALVLMKNPNLASAILGVGVLTLNDRRIGVACSFIPSSSGWLVIALFFVAGVIFLLAFTVMALFLSGETPRVSLLGGASIGYLALKAFVTSVVESSDTATSENYTVSITITLTKTLTLT